MAKPAEKPASTATAEDEKNLVAQKPGALALPSYMQGQGGAGLEQITGADVQTPRIKLLQGTSPELELYENARTGTFWHDMAEVGMGTEVPLTFLYVDKRALLWRPRPEGGILARSDDLITWVPSGKKFEVKLAKSEKIVTWDTGRNVVQSGLLEWGSSDPDNGASQPAGTLMFNFLARFGGDFSYLPPAVVTLQRTSAKVGRKLLGRLKVMNGAPLYGIRLVMSRFQDDGQGQKFWNYKFEVKGLVDDEQEFNENKTIYEAVKRVGLKVREEDEDLLDEVSGAAGEAASNSQGDGKAAY